MTKIPLTFRWEGIILYNRTRKEGSAMIFDTDRRMDDVDDLIFDRTTVTPSQR